MTCAITPNTETIHDRFWDTIIDWSRWRARTECAVPGVGILPTVPANVKIKKASSNKDGYSTSQGISMATPHVVGLFAMGLTSWRFHPCSDMY